MDDFVIVDIEQPSMLRVVDAGGKKIARASATRIVKDDGSDSFDIVFDEEPKLPNYSPFHFRPIDGIDRVIAHCASRPFETFRAVCATCQETLLETDIYDKQGRQVAQRRALDIIVAASDHARISINHAVFIVREHDDKPIWKSRYDILGTCCATSTRMERVAAERGSLDGMEA